MLNFAETFSYTIKLDSMKTGKQPIRSLLFIFLLVLSSVSYSQVRVGVKAGANYYNINVIDYANYPTATNMKPGFHAGMFVDIPLSEKISFQPALLLSNKGYKLKQVGVLYTTVDTFYFNGIYIPDPYYIEMPLNFLYTKDIRRNSFFIGAGPYVAYGIGGKWKYNIPEAFRTSFITSGKLQFLEDYATQSDSASVLPYTRKIDLGAGAILGYEFAKKYSVQLGGQFGLLNLEPYSDGKRPSVASQITYGLSLSLGYKF